MRTLLLGTACVLFLPLASFAQSNIPAAVKDAFTKKFANAKSVKWEGEEDGEYEVAFKMEGKKMEGKFAKNGNWLETETEISEDKLPVPVKKAIAAQFSDFEIDVAETVHRPDSEMTYEVLLDQDNLTLKVEFSASGKVLHKEVVEED